MNWLKRIAMVVGVFLIDTGINFAFKLLDTNKDGIIDQEEKNLLKTKLISKIKKA